MTREAAKHDGVVVITGAKIVTMDDKDGGVIENGAIVIDGDRITAVGPAGAITVPAGAVTIDAAGKTIVPGLVDAHDHGSHGHDELVPPNKRDENVNLALGTPQSRMPQQIGSSSCRAHLRRYETTRKARGGWTNTKTTK